MEDTPSRPPTPDSEPVYVLCLFISGQTRGSMRAVESVQKLCEEHLQGRYHLEIVDMYQQPERLREEQVLASPTLIKKLPLPIRKLVGALSDEKRVLAAIVVPPPVDSEG